MSEVNYSTRPCTLTNEVHISIIGAIPYVIIPTQVAAQARISQQKLSYWLKRGAEEAALDEDTPYSRLFVDFKYSQSLEVSKLIEKIRCEPENYKAYAWLLEKCFRSDFGPDSDEMKELREQFRVILLTIGKGAPNGQGREMDSGRNQETRQLEESVKG